MLSDRHAACVATALALCLIKEKNRQWIQEWYKRRPQDANENFMTDLMKSDQANKTFTVC
jgi:hypothetical protein